MPKRTKEELDHELEMLRAEHDLIKTGLSKGMFSVFVLILVLPVSLFMFDRKAELLGATHYLIVVGIIVAAVLIYFAFVFNRQLKIRAKLSEKIMDLELSAGNEAK